MSRDRREWDARYWSSEKARKTREAWLASEAGKESRAKYLHSPKNIAKQTLRTRAWRERYPEKWAAHKAVKRALAAGTLQKPSSCEDCGVEGLRIEAHHDDYSQPLVVRWVCKPCHLVRHGRLEADLA